MINIILLVLAGQKVEIIGGIDQFALYFVFSVLFCSIGTSAYCFIRYFGTGLEEMLITPIYGNNGLIITLLMYARIQLKGEPIVSNIPYITYHNTPLIILAFQLLLWLVGLGKLLALDLPFTVISIFFSWSYLRFYYRFQSAEVNTNNSVQVTGDQSEEFQFIKMFPEALYAIALPLSIGFYNIIALFGIYPQLENTDVNKRPAHHLYYNGTNNIAGAESPLIATNRQDIVQERRRAKAMKLLDAKMAELQKEDKDDGGWDDNDKV